MQAINFLNLQKNPYFYKKKQKNKLGLLSSWVGLIFYLIIRSFVLMDQNSVFLKGLKYRITLA